MAASKVRNKLTGETFDMEFADQRSRNRYFIDNPDMTWVNYKSWEVINLDTEEISKVEFETDEEFAEYLRANPNIGRAITGMPAFGCPVRLGITKSDSGWKEVLSKVADSQPKSNLKDQLSRNS